jgi:hypothetical protein
VLVIVAGTALALSPLVWMAVVLAPAGPTGPSDGETAFWAGVETAATIAFLGAFIAAVGAAIWVWTLHLAPGRYRRSPLRRTTRTSDSSLPTVTKDGNDDGDTRPRG